MRSSFIAISASFILAACGTSDLRETGIKSTPVPGVKTSIQSATPIMPPSTQFSYYLLQANQRFLKEDKALGYDANVEGHTRDLSYNGESIFKLGKNKKSHCVGYTYQLLITALNDYFTVTKNNSVWNMPVDWTKGLPFKRCWYVEGSCLGARDALLMAKIGTTVSRFADLQAGDFVNYDRNNKTGHSTMFLNFIDKNGKFVAKYDDSVVGFNYTSSQETTNGIATKYAFFEDKCNYDIPMRDCGVIRSSLIMGRVSSPEAFQQVTEPPSNSFFSTKAALHVNARYLSDLGSENLY